MSPGIFSFLESVENRPCSNGEACHRVCRYTMCFEHKNETHKHHTENTTHQFKVGGKAPLLLSTNPSIPLGPNSYNFTPPTREISSMGKQTDTGLEKYQGNYIIPVIGPSGAGKSFFINQLVGAEVVKVGHSLYPCTTDLMPVEVPADTIQHRIPLWNPVAQEPAKLIILDTPGFDDSNRVNDFKILKGIADWITDTYGPDTQLAGAIYLQDISQQRVTGVIKQNIEVFDKLWGLGARKSVVLGTTQWTRIPAIERKIAKCREQELQKCWKDMVGKGSRVHRVDDKNTSPWKLVEAVLLKGKSSIFQKRSVKAQFEKYQGDYIIPVMGLTGAGKSSFINQLVGHEVVEVGYSFNSCTKHPQPVEVPVEIIRRNLPLWNLAESTAPAKKLIMVDTPGFDDTSADDSEVLKRVADWLVKSYGAGAKLAGVIYLQDILQRRITGATKRNFEVFDKLCGVDAFRCIVIGTTQWKRIPPHEREMAEAREQELRDHLWKDMIGKGSTMQRVDDKNTITSPWKLVETIIFKGESPTLQIQKEMVKLEKSLPQTEAAKVLRRRTKDLLKSLKDGGATKEDIMAFAQEVKALKEKSLFAHFLGRFFGSYDPI